MKVVIDGMGGDKGAPEILKGVELALREISDIEIIITGKEQLLNEIIDKMNLDRSRLKVVNAEEVIEMDEDPIITLKTKKNSSLSVGLDVVKNGEGDAFVSAGNTGAHISTSQLKLRRIKGVLRPGIATVFPTKKENIVFMDMGANADTKPEFINQFAIMGSEFAKEILKKENPKVGLLNIGSEEGKGNELTRTAYELLKENKEINFVGNIESREITSGDVDVVVTDGFTGNMVLKTSEGMVKFIFDVLKEEIGKSFFAKIGYLFMKNALRGMKKKLDSSEYGGAMFIGLNGLSLKAHGNSDAIAFKNAIKVANDFAKNEFIKKLKTKFENNNSNI